MEQFMTELFNSWKLLYNLFGYWSLALAGIAYLLMIPANYGVKKLFARGKQTDPKIRLRKTVSALLIFVITGGVVALFVGLIKKQPLNFDIIFQGAIPTGIIAKLLHWLMKMINELGLQVVLTAIARTQKVQHFVKTELGINGITYDICIDFVKEHFGKDFDFLAFDTDAQAKANATAKLETRLRGFASDPKGTANKIIQYILNGEHKEDTLE